jgi:photosystem II stability/assembly factor-like uncharacterized protein
MTALGVLMRRRFVPIILALACTLAAVCALWPPGASASPLVWTPQISGTEEWLEGITFAGPSTGWIVGDGGTILHTENGGQTWAPQASGSQYDLSSVVFVGSSLGWAVGGAGTIIHTMDGGDSWAPQDSQTPWSLNEVDFASQTEGWAAGNGMILHTGNGGASWEKDTLPARPPGVSSYWFEAIDFVGANDGWAAGWDGVILHSPDGGATWAVQSTPVANDLEDVFFLDSQNGWAVGVDGTILHTTNGGASWGQQNTPVTEDVNAVWFGDALTGWAVGDSGTLLHTTDGGATWLAQTLSSTYYLRDVTFTGPNSGWAVGLSGDVLHTASPAGLSFTVSPATVAYNGTVVARGTLLDAAAVPLPGRTVVLDRSYDGSHWTALRSLVSATGSYATSVKIVRKTYFRLRFAGDAGYAPAVSSKRSAICRASVTPPAVPSYVRSGVRVTAYGYVRPQHTSARSSMIVYLYRYQSGKWRLRATTSVYSGTNVVGATRYGVRIYILNLRGKWRVAAAHADADHVRTMSAYRYFVVR